MKELRPTLRAALCLPPLPTGGRAAIDFTFFVLPVFGKCATRFMRYYADCY